jgi:hypothetical protein
MEKGIMEVQTLPFYTIRKTRPPILLGRLFNCDRIGWFKMPIEKECDV